MADDKQAKDEGVSAKEHKALMKAHAEATVTLDALKAHVQPAHFPVSPARWLEMHALLHGKPDEA